MTTKTTQQNMGELIEDLKKCLINGIDCLEEAHMEEVEADHYGDGPDGCSYCEAISKGRAALAKAKES